MGGIGDDLIVSSVFPGLKAKYGWLEVITRPPAGVVFENHPAIDRLTMWPEKEEPEGAEFWRRMLNRRLEEYEFGVHLSHSCEATLAAFEAQPMFWWPAKMRRKLAEHSYLGWVHDICDLPHDFGPWFEPTEVEEAQARATLDGLRGKRPGPVIGWCLSGSRIDKIYPGTVQVIICLIGMGFNVAMFGKPDKEYEMACEVQKQVQLQFGTIDGLYLMMTSQDSLGPGTRVIARSSTGETAEKQWPIRRSLATIQQCDVVVGPDTGAMWAVAMRPMPKVMLLSHASALNITHGWANTTTLHASPDRVPCWPCHQLHDRWETCNKHPELNAAACMADIRIADVVDAVAAAVRKGEEPIYFPRLFDAPSIDTAKAIILTAEKNAPTERRWEEETPFLLDLISKSIDLDANSVVLDYGCGIGRLAKELIARWGCQVVGVDISASMRKLADEYVRSSLFSVVTPAELDDMIDGGATFTAALAVWVLQHCPDVRDDIDRIERALGPDGQLFMVGQKGRAIPTRKKWFNDGVDVEPLLLEKFHQVSREPMPADLADYGYWSVLRVSKELSDARVPDARSPRGSAGSKARGSAARVARPRHPSGNGRDHAPGAT